MNVSVKEITKDDFQKVQDFYTSVEYMQELLANDKVVAAFIENKIVGAGRISTENGVFVLRGMHIDRSMLKQGIGRKILNELDKIIGERDCYCIPHDWLEYFYSIIGFKKIEIKSAPKFLEERMLSYKDRFPTLIIMKR